MAPSGMSLETLLDPSRGIVPKGHEQNVMDVPVLHSTDHTSWIRDGHPPTPRPSRQPGSLPWEPTRPQDKAYVWQRIEAPLPPSRPRPKCNFIIHDNSSGTDHFTAWAKVSLHEVLVQHMKGGLVHLLKQTVSTNILLLDHFFQRRLSIYN